MSDPDLPSERSKRLRRPWGRGFGHALKAVLARPRLAEVDWESLEATLLAADVGVAGTEEVLAGLRRRLARDADAEAREALRDELVTLLDPAAARSLRIGAPGDGQAVAIVVVGVNGVGKTTTVGKIARLLVDQGYSVVIGAADTFRAAAADQIATWGARAGVEVVRADQDGADPAAVAFSAGERAREVGADVLLIDTAGRLQNKRDLMDELGKTLRVLGRSHTVAEVLLVLDATTGQNGFAQARVFSEVAAVTGIVLAKLDGSARGGVVIPVQRELGVPVVFVGLGEGADDLVAFDPGAFVEGLLA